MGKEAIVVNGKLRAIFEFSRELDGSLGANRDDEIGSKILQIMIANQKREDLDTENRMKTKRSTSNAFIV